MPPSLDIVRVPAFNDNYLWLLREPSGRVAVVDPGDVAPVQAALAERDWTLSDIFLTHHHPDHVGGVMALKAATGASVTGAAHDRRLPGVDHRVQEGDIVPFGTTSASVIEVPGHTLGHIAYFFGDLDEPALFSGDTLFSLGCGRMFEGDPVTFWNSLSKLKALPDATRVYCAHEYTASNLKFARSVDPDNPALARFGAEIDALRAKGLPTVPSRLIREKACNPFLRADDPALAAALGLRGHPPAEVFGALRRQKDIF